MEKSFKKVVLTILFGWLLYSMTGTIPMSMAIPLPDFMHTNKSALSTGYTDENALKSNADKEIVKKNTFENFDLFSDCNAMQNAHYDSDKDIFLIDTNAGTWEMEANNPSNSKLYKGTERGLAYRTSKYQYLVRADAKPVIGSKKGSYLTIQNWKIQYSIAQLRDVLEQQTREKITPKELACLLQFRTNGILMWWDKDTGIAVLNNDGYCSQPDGDTVSHPEIVLKCSLMTDADTVVGYDETTKSLVEQKLSTGAKKVLAPNIKDVMTINATMRREQPVIGGIIDAHSVFIYDYQTQDINILDLGNDFEANRFIFGDDDFLITAEFEESSFNWKRGEF